MPHADRKQRVPYQIDQRCSIRSLSLVPNTLRRQIRRAVVEIERKKEAEERAKQ